MTKGNSKNKRDKAFEERVVAATYDAIKQVRREVENEERLFQCVTGARLAIDAMFRAGMLTDNAVESVKKWHSVGGYAVLTYKNVRVFPPELP